MVVGVFQDLLAEYKRREIKGLRHQNVWGRSGCSSFDQNASRFGPTWLAG